MGRKQVPAKDVAKPRGPDGYWIDHAVIVPEDIQWLASAERLTLWNVKVPQDFFTRTKKLWWLDIRGGSASDLNVLRGTTSLRYLAVNQVRGMLDLSVISTLSTLLYLDLYGLPQITNLPSCQMLSELECARLGQMRALESLRGVLQAPKLRDLQLVRKINVNSEDIQEISRHPSLKRFDWFAEDVPDAVWVPVRKQIRLPTMPTLSPNEWFVLRKA